MKKISMTRWVIIVTIAVLIITGGWSILHRSENGSQISQSEGNGPSPEVRQSLMQPTKGSGVTQQQPTNDKSGLQASSPTASIPPGYSSEIIQIKFKEGTKVDPPEAALPPDLRNSVANINTFANYAGTGSAGAA